MMARWVAYLSVGPVYFDAQLFDYFAAVQDGCALPIVLQDHPASTGVFMGAELLVQICAHLASVQCIKLEAVPTSA